MKIFISVIIKIINYFKKIMFEIIIDEIKFKELLKVVIIELM